MSKFNKYWGLAAVGAVTAAIAGAAAAVLVKKNRDRIPAFEDDFEEDFDECEEAKASDDFASWDSASHETQETAETPDENAEAPDESTEPSEESAESSEENTEPPEENAEPSEGAFKDAETEIPAE